MIGDGQEAVGGSEQLSLSEFESARIRLRQRWELASVLNFFMVFESIMETNLKISAGEVENALICPNKSLAQLHIVLLKGIPPVSKNLKDNDAWVVSLSKKLNMWWPWVAEGDFPLTAAKGQEMAAYKELDATTRLVILKALCEIRADQHDIVSYINSEVKSGNPISNFRKNKLGEDGNDTSYWYDGNEIIGFRLYKEVCTSRGKEAQSTINCQWETLATNLEEFQKVVGEFASSESKLKVDVSKTVETEVIPVLNKIHKKKQRALQQKQREEKLINNFCRPGMERSCRSRKPIKYTFDEYDKVIEEAIRETKKRKTKEEPKNEKKENVPEKDAEQDNSSKDDESSEIETESENSEDEDVSEDSSEESAEEQQENDTNDEEKSNDGNRNHATLTSESQNGTIVDKSKILTEKMGRSVSEIRNFGAKKRLRQRPNRNTALESAVVSDSGDEIYSDKSDS